ncbi:MAG: hypothetical protein ACR2NB_03890 [Solirubrobacteraceae bacterium]
MAMKEKRGIEKAPANPADALPDAVERTFQGGAGGASGSGS